MADTRTQRSTCRFIAEKGEGGKSVLKLQLFHGVDLLRNAVLGFDLLGGITVDEAKKVAELLNENILDVFVTLSDEHPMFPK